MEVEVADNVAIVTQDEMSHSHSNGVNGHVTDHGAMGTTTRRNQNKNVNYTHEKACMTKVQIQRRDPSKGRTLAQTNFRTISVYSICLDQDKRETNHVLLQRLNEY